MQLLFCNAPMIAGTLNYSSVAVLHKILKITVENKRWAALGGLGTRRPYQRERTRMDGLEVSSRCLCIEDARI